MNPLFPIRVGAIVLVAACVSCTVGSNGGTTGFGSGQTSLGSGDGDGDGTGETTGDETGSTSDTDDSSSSSSSTTDSSSSSSSSSSTTDPTSSSSSSSSSTGGGGQPDSGMYSHCLDAAPCSAFCLTIGDPVTDGFCTEECIGGNPGNCDAAPQDSNAVPSCIVVSAYDLCALDCAGGKMCPAGMVCGGVMTDNGAVDICY